MHAEHSRRKTRLLPGIAVGVIGLLVIAFTPLLRGADVLVLPLAGPPLVFAGLGALAYGGRVWARRALLLWLLVLVVGTLAAAEKSRPVGTLLFLVLALLFTVAFCLLSAFPVRGAGAPPSPAQSDQART